MNIEQRVKEYISKFPEEIDFDGDEVLNKIKEAYIAGYNQALLDNQSTIDYIAEGHAKLYNQEIEDIEEFTKDIK